MGSDAKGRRETSIGIPEIGFSQRTYEKGKDDGYAPYNKKPRSSFLSTDSNRVYIRVR